MTNNDRRAEADDVADEKLATELAERENFGNEYEGGGEVPAISLLDAEIETAEPSEKDLLALMKAWRGGRATTNFLTALFDGYITLFAVALVGTMVANLIITTQRNVASCTAAGCVSARALLPWAMFAGLLSAALALALMFGPVLASAAEGFWLFDAPIRRAKILSKRLILIVLAGGAVAAVLAALVAALTGSTLTAIGAWTLASGVATSFVIAFAAAEQGAERTVFVKLIQLVAGLACIAAMGLVIAISVGLVDFLPKARSSAMIAFGIAGGSAIMLLLALGFAFTRLNKIRRARLLSGGALVSGMQGAAYALDLALLRDILVERNMIKKGWVRPTLGLGRGAQALVWRDLQRLLRNPKSIAGVLIAGLVPYAVSALGMAALSPFFSGLVLCFMLVPTMNSLRVLTRTPGLARMFPMSTGTIRTACMAVPAGIALVWAAAVVPAFAAVTSNDQHQDVVKAIEYAVITGFAGVMGAARWTTVKQVNFNTPMLSTGAGAMPPSLIFNLFRGFDMVALITAPIIFNLSPWFSVIIALIVFMGMRGSFDMDELQAAKAEQQRLADMEKKKMDAKKAEKIKITRGR